MSATTTSAYEWSNLPWRKLEQSVFKLQKRIYKASARGDTKTIHRLQRLLMKSEAARLLAVRKVTQDNRGKRTAGVDGAKNFAPKQRLALATDLKVEPSGKPVRRVWIPKPGKTERRPLGIPVLRDRAAQTLARFALEPEWEAHFEPNSYGFRPGRSAHDAIEAVFSGVSRKAKWVLDADIASCFDRIDHKALLAKLNTFPFVRRAIRGWLKAGVLDGARFSPTTEGTPQGGSISPLLMNVALHGLETAIRAAFPSRVTRGGKAILPWPPIVVRYADDFVVLHQDRDVIEQTRHIAAEWLTGMGLELKPEKTRIVHTLDRHDDQVGFDFLGFNVRQHRVGKHHTARSTNGEPLGFKAIISPSQDAQKRHAADMAAVLRRNLQAPQEAVIDQLNAKIQGWTGYHRLVPSRDAFHRMDYLLYQKLRRWAQRRHPKKSPGWVARKYWHSDGARNWVFGVPHRAELLLHSAQHRKKHVKVVGAASPFDGNLVYWASRLGRHPELPPATALLLKRQGGRCALCGLYFYSLRDVMEVDHVTPAIIGGSDVDTNHQLLHGHCHDRKTADDGSLRRMAATQRARATRRPQRRQSCKPTIP